MSSSRLRYNDVQLSPLEVVHVADTGGRRCSQCGTEIAAHTHRYMPYQHVVVVDRDPAASWVTTRAISCGGQP